jgi:diadenylate cyclase
MRLLGWILESLILAAAIHVFLRFVRQTRGSRLIRGLFVAGVVGVVGLWGLSRALALEELEYLLSVSTGFLVVIVAIVFQPEMRRAIAQLGEQAFTRDGPRPAGADAVRRIVRAVEALAARRHGALIAFERDVSLQPYIEAGTPIDAATRTRLLESIFQPGSVLHDGGVVVRWDRVAAAGCIFPLPAEAEAGSRLGTRHRAALGLSEETDAIVLVVSEESGAISLAHAGRLQLDVARDGLEDELLRLLAPRSRRGARSRGLGLAATLAALRREGGWIVASLALASGTLFVAHQGIRETREFAVRVLGSTASAAPPEHGTLWVVLEDPAYRVVAPPPDQTFLLEVTGSRGALDELAAGPSGRLALDPRSWTGGMLPLSAVRWAPSATSLSFEWADALGPELEIERFGEREVVLSVEGIALDLSRLDPRFEVRHEDIAFLPSARVRIAGPERLLAALGAAPALDLEPIVMTPADRVERRVQAHLSPELVRAGFALDELTPVEVVVPIRAARREIGSVVRPVALIDLDPSRSGETGCWRLPAALREARFRIQTSGLVPVDADPTSPALLERIARLRRFVEDNLQVYVDLAELPPDGSGRAVPLRWTWRVGWRAAPEALGLDAGTLGAQEELTVELESEREVLLEPVDPGSASSAATRSER